MPDSKRWLLWSAVSTLPQAKKISNEDQLRLGREAAAKHNGVIVGELVVPGESRSIVLFEDACQRIEAYAQFRQHIQDADFDVFCYFDRSRLGRTAALSMTVVELCREAGIVCYDIESPPHTLDASQNTNDLLIGAVKSVEAQSEVRRLVERRAKGMRGRVLSGKMPGKPNYGYMYDETGKNIIINENEAAVVRRVVELYLQGRGIERVKEVIVGEFGVDVTRRYYMILDRINIYAGYTEFNAYPELNSTRYTSKNYIKAKGLWQPIISEEAAERVKKERKSRSKKSASEGQCYLLSSVCFCEICNRSMSIAVSSDIFLRCRRGEAHERRYVKQSVIIEELKEAIALDLSAEDVPAPANDELLQRLIKSRTIHADALLRITQSRKRADDAYVDGVLSPKRYREQMARLSESEYSHETQIESINEQIERESNRTQYEAERRSTMGELLSLLDSDDVQYINYKLRNTLRIYVLNGHISRIAMV